MSGWASNNVRPKLWYSFETNAGTVYIDLYSVEVVEMNNSENMKTTIYLDNGKDFKVNKVSSEVQVLVDDIS